MLDLGFLLGSLPGFVLLLSLLGIGGLLYFAYRLFRPKHSRRMHQYRN